MPYPGLVKRGPKNALNNWPFCQWILVRIRHAPMALANVGIVRAVSAWKTGTKGYRRQKAWALGIFGDLRNGIYSTTSTITRLSSFTAATLRMVRMA